jgi:signal transduction histidine kinase
LITDFIFVFLLYIVAADRIFFLIAFIIVFTLLQVIYLFYLEYKSEQKRKILVKNFFLNRLLLKKETGWLQSFGSDWKNIINRAFFQMKEMEEKLDQKDKDLDSYREFIEEWTHEIKTPTFCIKTSFTKPQGRNLSLCKRQTQIYKYKYRKRYRKNSLLCQGRCDLQGLQNQKKLK